MGQDRTGEMLRDYYNSFCCTAGGILALLLIGGGTFVAHEVFQPSGRVLPLLFSEVIQSTKSPAPSLLH